MTLLFDDRLAPITSEVGFVEADAETVSNFFYDWESRHQQSRGVTIGRRRVEGQLRDLLEALLPLTSVEHRRYLFVPTQSRWTAFFDNGFQGTDAGSLTYIAESMKVRAARVVAVADTMGSSRDSKRQGRYGATILELFNPKPVRAIAAVNDGGRWVFDVSGSPLAFEETTAYEARRVRDRFTPEMLDRYLRALGIDAFNDRFYAPDRSAIMLERRGPTAPGLREFSLQEARDWDQ